MTTPQHWQRVQSALAELLELSAEAREQRLQQWSHEDAALAAELRELLAHADAPRLPESLPWQHLKALDRSLMPGQRLDEFVIIAELGQGGSGVVYRAMRETPFRQQVALKLLGHAAPDPTQHRRFAHERDVLAALEHPGIVRLIDARLRPDGQAYLVLELVDGLSWTPFWQQYSGTGQEALRIFLKLCEAVAYAHQHLIVHRDLKPGNVLFDQHGQPRILDFGIAKLLQADPVASTLTREFGASMTLAFAAPEQLLGQVITTATDVHALGLLLFDLLVGQHAFASAYTDADRLRTALCHEPAPRLIHQPLRFSWRKSQVQDLTRVLAKALDKDPRQRYAGAAALADDVAAVIIGRPVQARHATLGYVVQRFVGRHRLAVSASVIAVAALCASTWYAFAAADRANLERDRAEQRFAEVHHFASTVLFGYHEQLRRLSGSMPLQQQIIRDAKQYLESLLSEAGDHPEVQLDVAEAWLRIGDLQGSSYGPNLGDFAASRASYSEAEKRFAALPPTRTPDARRLMLRANLLKRQADLAWQDSDLPTAKARYQDAIAIYERLNVADRQSIDAVIEFTGLLDQYSDLLGREGSGSLNEVSASREAQQRARALRLAALEKHPDHPRLRFARYQSELREGEYWLGQGDLTQAEQALDQAQHTLLGLTEADPDNYFYRYELGLVQSRLVPLLDAKGELAASIDMALSALRTTEQLLEADPEHDTLRLAVSASAGWAARQLLRAGRLNEAAPIISRQIAVCEQRLRVSPENPEAQSSLSVAYRREADLAEARGDYQAAIESHLRAEALQSPTLGLSADFKQTWALSLMHLGRTHAKAGEFNLARPWFERAHAAFAELVRDNPEARRYLDDQAEAHAQAAEAAAATGRHDAWASAQADAALKIWGTMAAQGSLSPKSAQRREAFARALRRPIPPESN